MERRHGGGGDERVSSGSASRAFDGIKNAVLRRRDCALENGGRWKNGLGYFCQVRFL
jgi:hypothetical protein